MKIFYWISILVLCFIYGNESYSQTRTNLDIYYHLLEESYHQIDKLLSENDSLVTIEMHLLSDYSVLGNRIMTGILGKKRRTYSGDESDRFPKISYIIDNAETNYGEMFREGIFGAYLVPRTLKISGNFSVSLSTFEYREFNYTFTDTVKADALSKIENVSFEFTVGEPPAEPFIESLIEPIVAIGTAAVAVVLFFTIRSK